MGSVFGTQLRYEVSASTRSKFSSAQHTLAEIQDAWNRYVAAGGVTVEARGDVAAREFILVAKFQSAPPTTRSAAKFRSAISDSRSALNNAVFEIAAQAGLPHKLAKRMRFPVVAHEAEWEKVRSQAIDQLPGVVQERIRAVQPFVTNLIRKPENHPLFQISEAWNLDKHREHIVVSPMLALPEGKSLLSEMTATMEDDVEPKVLTPERVNELFTISMGPLPPDGVFGQIKLPNGVIFESSVMEVSADILGMGVAFGRTREVVIPMPFFPILVRYVERVLDYVCGVEHQPPAIRPEFPVPSTIAAFSATPSLGSWKMRGVVS